MNSYEIKLEQVSIESKAKLEKLMSLYLHDLSEFAADLKINEDGIFEYDGLQLYFKLDDLKPFFITYQGETAGFVLFNTGKYAPKGIDYVVHELFLLKGFRRKGIANAAIKKIMDMYKGEYKIVQIASNKKAVNFWTKFYEYQGIKYVESREILDDLECVMQTFSVK